MTSEVTQAGYDPEFVEAWSAQEAAGYIYSESNIAKVYMGWQMAKDRLTAQSGEVEAARLSVMADGGDLAVYDDMQAEILRLREDVARLEMERTLSGEGRENDKPPSHWAPGDKCDRHPQTVEEWNRHADGDGAVERSIKRLNFAVDRGDPHAPDQMAVVLRVDLSRVLGRLTHYTAHRELLMKKQSSGEGRCGAAADAMPQPDMFRRA